MVRRDIEHARNGNSRIHAGLGTRHPCRVTSGLPQYPFFPHTLASLWLKT